MGRIAEFIEKRAGWRTGDERWWSTVIGGKTASGVDVSESTALKATTVYACVKLISESIATLPLFLYRRMQPRGKERAVDHELFNILHNTPNPEMSSTDIRAALQGHIELWGNGYAEIEWSPRGRIRNLWPLRPDRVRVGRLEEKALMEHSLPDRFKGELIYEYRTSTGDVYILPAYKVLHVPGFGFTGLKGYSPIALARQSIGLALATEEYGARFFANGARPGGVLTHPKLLTDEAAKRLKVSWNEMHQGLSNQHRIAILEEGLEYKQIGIPPEDAQFLETRKFQLGEIARIFGVPPHLIGDTEKSTSWGTGIEQQNIGFLQYTLRPRLVRWEQRILLRLIYPEQRREYFAEHLVDGLMRGDAQARGEYYNKLFMIGVFSPNDIREKENLNPVDGGDLTYVPLNMVPANQAEQLLGNPESNTRINHTLSRTAESFDPVFRSSIERIIRRERDTVIRMARKHLGSETPDVGEFQRWLDEYYPQFADYAGRQIHPAAQTLAETTNKVVAEQLRSTPLPAADIDIIVARYKATFADDYSSVSKQELNAAAGESLAVVEAVVERWISDRAAQVAESETRHLAAEIQEAVAGVRSQ